MKLFGFKRKGKRVAGVGHLPALQLKKVKSSFMQAGEEASLRGKKRLENERERLLRGEKPKSRFSNKQQRTAARLLIGFFLLIIAFTLLSRGATSLAIASVTAASPKSGVITQRFTLSGTIEAQDSLEILLPANLRITNVLVKAGDRVQEGDPLLEVDADQMQDLLQQLEHEVEILELKLENSSKEQAETGTDQIKQAEKNLQYAQEDYQNLESELELDASRLDEDLKAAQDAYDAALAGVESAAVKAREALIEAAQAEISRAEKALRDAEYNRTEAIAAAETAVEIAEEDADNALRAYEEAVSALHLAEETLSTAQDQLAALESQTNPSASEKELEDARKRVESAQAEVTKAQSQVDAAERNLSDDAVERARENLERVTQRQNQLVDEAEDALRQAEEAWMDAQNREDLSDEAQVVAAQSALDAAEAGLKAAKRSRQDFALSAQEQRLAASRAVEKAKDDLKTAQKQAANTVQAEEETQLQKEVERLQYTGELREKRKMQDQLKAVQAQGGIVVAPVAGTVKTAPEQTGMTQDGTATVTLARSDQSFEFWAMVDQKTAEQLTVGDEGTLSYTDLGSSQSAAVQISSIGAPNENGEVRIIAILQKGNYSSGISANLEVEKYSQQYSLLLPLSALRTIDGKSVVLIIREEQSVMGAEQTVDEVEVTVKAQDSENMAVEGALLPDDQVVVSASKAVEKGDRVRVEG